MASIFLFAWSAGAGSVAAAFAVILVVMAASAEGLIAIWELVARGAPLVKLRDLNIDAITAWKFHGLRIDGVHRTMLYTPQHGLSCALALLALAPVDASWRQRAAGCHRGERAAPRSVDRRQSVSGRSVLARLRPLHRRPTPFRSRSLGIALVSHAWAAVPPVVAVALGNDQRHEWRRRQRPHLRPRRLRQKWADRDAADVAGAGAAAGPRRVRSLSPAANASGDACRLRACCRPRLSLLRDAVGEVVGRVPRRADPAGHADRATGQRVRTAADVGASRCCCGRWPRSCSRSARPPW